jgi:hypothetical protein
MFADPEKLTPAPAEVYRFLFPHHSRYHQMKTNRQMLVMAFVDITEDNISELMKSKDSKSTQSMLLGMGGAYERLVKINKCRLSNEMNG